ncbi:DUF461 domain-containing protein [Streptomyces sp. CB01881]|uniref:DUF461 domain-containing protein n=1 Tax=Streptomyces sp. CB01881 TaxID=2078691 RepID=UPI00129C433C|nr:DUF461 domain-containing protein [Streptomyces sp. CB01881]
MSRSLRVGSIAAIAALAIASLSSCAAGNTPDTLEIKPDNAQATLGTNIRLNNIVVVTAGDASGDYTGPANVSVNVSNSGTTPVELQSVTVGTSAATFADDKGAPVGSIVIPAGGAVLLGGVGNPVAKVASVSVVVGGYAPTTFGFKSGEKVETEAAVSPDKGLYKGWGPTASPAAVPSKAAGSPTAPAAATAPAPATGAAAPGTAPTGAATTAAATPTAATH